MTPFEPNSSATVNISVSSSSQSVLVQNYSGCNQIRVCNNGTATVWVNFGGSGVAATLAADIPIPAGAVEVLSIPSAASTIYAAAIAAGSSGSIYFTPGAGI